MANYGGATISQHQRVVSGLFRDRYSAERAYDLVMDQGYTGEETSVVMLEETRGLNFEETAAGPKLSSKVMESAGVGGAIGSAIGGLLGAIAGVDASVALPGFGIAVAGPLIAALSGAGAGGVAAGVAGGLIGALAGSRIPEERPKHRETGIKGGGILISVAPRTAYDAAWIEHEWRNLDGDTATH